jgi:hypothetical protein
MVIESLSADLIAARWTPKEGEQAEVCDEGTPKSNVLRGRVFTARVSQDFDRSSAIARRRDEPPERLAGGGAARLRASS